MAKGQEEVRRGEKKVRGGFAEVGCWQIGERVTKRGHIREETLYPPWPDLEKVQGKGKVRGKEQRKDFEREEREKGVKDEVGYCQKASKTTCVDIVHYISEAQS